MLLALVALTVIYVCLFAYARAVRRERLERQWDADGARGDRTTFIENRLAAGDASVRRWLVLFVYVIPMSVLIVVVTVLNTM